LVGEVEKEEARGLATGAAEAPSAAAAAAVREVAVSTAWRRRYRRRELHSGRQCGMRVRHTEARGGRGRCPNRPRVGRVAARGVARGEREKRGEAVEAKAGNRLWAGSRMCRTRGRARTRRTCCTRRRRHLWPHQTHRCTACSAGRIRSQPSPHSRHCSCRRRHRHATRTRAALQGTRS